MSYPLITQGRLPRLAAALLFVSIGYAASTHSPAIADDVPASAQAAYDEIQGALGDVPGFVRMYPPAGIAGAWTLTRDLQYGETSLDAKTKALISLAVAAQIPCGYCVWSDTRDALAAGATEDQIHEAVAIAGLTRHWSTIFNGYQIDFAQFRRELGDEMASK